MLVRGNVMTQLRDGSNMLTGIHWREYAGGELVELVQSVGLQVEKHYCFMTHRPSLIANPVFRLFPSTRPSQTLWATKIESMVGCFDCRRLLRYNSAD